MDIVILVVALLLWYEGGRRNGVGVMKVLEGWVVMRGLIRPVVRLDGTKAGMAKW